MKIVSLKDRYKTLVAMGLGGVLRQLTTACLPLQINLLDAVEDWGEDIRLSPAFEKRLDEILSYVEWLEPDPNCVLSADDLRRWLAANSQTPEAPQPSWQPIVVPLPTEVCVRFYVADVLVEFSGALHGDAKVAVLFTQDGEHRRAFCPVSGNDVILLCRALQAFAEQVG